MRDIALIVIGAVMSFLSSYLMETMGYRKNKLDKNTEAHTENTLHIVRLEAKIDLLNQRLEPFVRLKDDTNSLATRVRIIEHTLELTKPFTD